MVYGTSYVTEKLICTGQAAAVAVASNTPTLWSLRGALCFKAGVSTLQMMHRKLLAKKYRVTNDDSTLCT